jgi:DNA-binding MarR family transcriptional regulator
MSKATRPTREQCLAMGMTCACHNLRRAARAVTIHYDGVFEPLGLRATQFTILAALAWNDGPNVSTLAEVLVLDQSSLSRNLAVLRRRGLVRSERGADRRNNTVHLTPAGSALLARGYTLWRRAQRAIEKALGPAQLDESLHVLRKLTRIAQAEARALASATPEA